VTDSEHARLLSAVDVARDRLQRVRDHHRSPGIYTCDEWCILCAEGDVQQAESDLAWFLFRRDAE